MIAAIASAAAIDGGAERWSAMRVETCRATRVEACRATRVEGRQSALVLDPASRVWTAGSTNFADTIEVAERAGIAARSIKPSAQARRSHRWPRARTSAR